LLKILKYIIFLERAFLALQLLCALVPSQNIKGKKGVKVAVHDLQKYVFRTIKVKLTHNII
jgi:hypothetical protein